ncbi:MAG: tetratricopeptide repeat protein [Myxococcota bacterium]
MSVDHELDTLFDGEAPVPSRLPAVPSEMQTFTSVDRAGPETTLPQIAMGEPVTEPCQAPATIGRLEVHERLGSGAMGDVFRAYDAELERDVAVKLVRRGERDDARRRRLQREARALARVSHPHVVHVFDVGVHEGQVFVAMELVAGQTLTTWLRSTTRSNREILRIFIEAGRGLQAAHEAGVIHRDFKPDNVMVDDGGHARVLDFGLAKTEETEATKSGRVVRPHTTARAIGQLVGTPAYMAPEQILGAKIDARSDVFSYCVALWEALFGQRPFAGVSAFELVWSISKGQRRPPPRGVRVPVGLRRVLDRGLETEPEQRWPDMHSLLEALEREQRWPDRVVMLLATPIVFAALLVPLLLTEDAEVCDGVGDVVGEAWTAARRDEVRQAHEQAALPYARQQVERTLTSLDEYAEAWRSARLELCVAARVEAAVGERERAERAACFERTLASFEEVVTLLADPGDEPLASVVESAPQIVQALPRLVECEHGHGEAAMGEAALAHGLRLARLRTRVAAGRYRDAYEPLVALQAELEELPVGPVHAEVRVTVAKAQEGQGQLDDAMRTFEEAFDLAVATERASVAVAAATGLGNLVGYHRQRYAEGLIWARVARPFADALPEHDPLRMAPQGLEAAIAFRQGRFADALVLDERILDHDRAVYGDAHPKIAEDLTHLAAAHFYLGQRDRAVALWSESVDRISASLGPEHPQLGTPLHNLGIIAWQRDQPDEATRLFSRALEVARAARGEHHPAVAMPQVYLSAIDTRQGRYRAAEQKLDAAEAILRGLYDEHSVDLGTVSVFRGDLQLAQGRPAAALAAYDHGLEVIEAAGGPEHPRMARGLEGRGRTLLELGQPEEAIESLSRALEIRRQRYQGSPAVGETGGLLARALWGAGHPDEARDVAERTLERIAHYSDAEQVRRELRQWLDDRRHPVTEGPPAEYGSRSDDASSQ